MTNGLGSRLVGGSDTARRVLAGQVRTDVVDDKSDGTLPSTRLGAFHGDIFLLIGLR